MLNLQEEGGDWGDPSNAQLADIFQNLNLVEMQIREMDEQVERYMASLDSYLWVILSSPLLIFDISIKYSIEISYEITLRIIHLWKNFSFPVLTFYSSSLQFFYYELYFYIFTSSAFVVANKVCKTETQVDQTQ